MSKVVTPWGPIGYITYKRTYSRRLKENDPNSATEEFNQTVERIIKACRTQLKVGFTEVEEKRLEEIFLSLKGSVAGRFWWQLGTKTVDRLGLLSLQNCAGTVVDSIRAFTWTMDALMLGSGVGYNIQREYVYQLPKVRKVKIVRQDTNDADFIVPDSREGWVRLLDKVLKAHFKTGKGFTYSTICIRGKGAPIKGFGGVAAGPEELCWGMEQISGVLNARAGKKIRPIDALDVMNIIGFVVVAGNVRRSAQLAVGDMDDLQFLNAKNWGEGSIPNWRAMSNNSVACNDFKLLPDQFWNGYNGTGEAYGLINIKLSQDIGRLGETEYSDKNVIVFNPSLRKGTKIWTSEGIVEVQNLQDREFTVSNLNGNLAKAKCWLSGKNKRLYEITLTNGVKYYCTPEHKWPIYTKQGWVKCETTELKTGHLLPIVQRESLLYGKEGSYDEGFCVGWLYGDGWVTHRKDNNKTQYGWVVSNKDKESGIHLKISDFLKRITGNDHLGSEKESTLEFNSASEKLDNYLKSLGVSHKKNGLPSGIWNFCSEEFRKGFVDGMISSDGTVDKSYKGAHIRITQSNKKLIDDFGELLGFYGIKCTFSTYHIESQVFPNGKKYDREYDRYLLNISTRQSINHFRNIFKLSVRYKQENLNSISALETKPLYGITQEISEVRLTDLYEDVWDVTVFDDTHCFQLSHVVTGNCGEQSLAAYETCCLAEIFLPNISSKEELIEVAKYLYRINKHSLALPCHAEETEEVVHKHMRMGIGITGYLQATEEQKSWLNDTYKELRKFDKEYSKEHGWPESIKLTTTKPSGTLSLLPNVTPGVHPAYSKYYLRRIRIASNNPLVETCRQNGYDIEYQKNFDGTDDKNTVIVSFPISVPDGTVVAKDLTAIQQMEYVKRLQTEWSDNAVSCTVYYKPEELPEIKKWLKKNYNKGVKTMSFLLHKDHGFAQAPYEEITKEQFDTYSAKVKPITSGDVNDDQLESMECSSGVCPIR